jgi:hypothetical protein
MTLNLSAEDLSSIQLRRAMRSAHWKRSHPLPEQKKEPPVIDAEKQEIAPAERLARGWTFKD